MPTLRELLPVDTLDAKAVSHLEQGAFNLTRDVRKIIRTIITKNIPDNEKQNYEESKEFTEKFSAVRDLCLILRDKLNHKDLDALKEGITAEEFIQVIANIIQPPPGQTEKTTEAALINCFSNTIEEKKEDVALEKWRNSIIQSAINSFQSKLSKTTIEKKYDNKQSETIEVEMSSLSRHREASSSETDDLFKKEGILSDDDPHIKELREFIRKHKGDIQRLYTTNRNAVVPALINLQNIMGKAGLFGFGSLKGRRAIKNALQQIGINVSFKRDDPDRTENRIQMAKILTENHLRNLFIQYENNPERKNYLNANWEKIILHYSLQPRLDSQLKQFRIVVEQGPQAYVKNLIETLKKEAYQKLSSSQIKQFDAFMKINETGIILTFSNEIDITNTFKALKQKLLKLEFKTARDYLDELTNKQNAAPTVQEPTRATITASPIKPNIISEKERQKLENKAAAEQLRAKIGYLIENDKKLLPLSENIQVKMDSNAIAAAYQKFIDEFKSLEEKIKVIGLIDKYYQHFPKVSEELEKNKKDKEFLEGAEGRYKKAYDALISSLNQIRISARDEVIRARKESEAEKGLVRALTPLVEEALRPAISDEMKPHVDINKILEEYIKTLPDKIAAWEDLKIKEQNKNDIALPDDLKNQIKLAIEQAKNDLQAKITGNQLKKEKTRDKVIQEIYETERSFYDAMNAIAAQDRFALGTATLTEPLKGKEKAFAEFMAEWIAEPYHLLHETQSPLLAPPIPGDPDPINTLLDRMDLVIAIELPHLLNTFSTNALCTDHFNDTLGPLFNNLSKELPIDHYYQAHDHGPNLDFRSIMIMPLQRGPRYELLLKELEKRVTDADADSPHIPRIQEQIKAIKKAIDTTNTRLRQPLQTGCDHFYKFVTKKMKAAGLTVNGTDLISLYETLNQAKEPGLIPFKNHIGIYLEQLFGTTLDPKQMRSKLFFEAALKPPIENAKKAYEEVSTALDAGKAPPLDSFKQCMADAFTLLKKAITSELEALDIPELNALLDNNNDKKNTNDLTTLWTIYDLLQKNKADNPLANLYKRNVKHFLQEVMHENNMGKIKSRLYTLQMLNSTALTNEKSTPAASVTFDTIINPASVAPAEVKREEDDMFTKPLDPKNVAPAQALAKEVAAEIINLIKADILKNAGVKEIPAHIQLILDKIQQDIHLAFINKKNEKEDPLIALYAFSTDNTFKESKALAADIAKILYADEALDGKPTNIKIATPLLKGILLDDLRLDVKNKNPFLQKMVDLCKAPIGNMKEILDKYWDVIIAVKVKNGARAVAPFLLGLIHPKKDQTTAIEEIKSYGLDEGRAQEFHTAWTGLKSTEAFLAFVGVDYIQSAIAAIERENAEKKRAKAPISASATVATTLSPPTVRPHRQLATKPKKFNLITLLAKDLANPLLENANILDQDVKEEAIHKITNVLHQIQNFSLTTDDIDLITRISTDGKALSQLSLSSPKITAAIQNLPEQINVIVLDAQKAARAKADKESKIVAPQKAKSDLPATMKEKREFAGFLQREFINPRLDKAGLKGKVNPQATSDIQAVLEEIKQAPLTVADITLIKGAIKTDLRTIALRSGDRDAQSTIRQFPDKIDKIIKKTIQANIAAAAADKVAEEKRKEDTRIKMESKEAAERKAQEDALTEAQNKNDQAYEQIKVMVAQMKEAYLAGLQKDYGDTVDPNCKLALDKAEEEFLPKAARWILIDKEAFIAAYKKNAAEKAFYDQLIEKLNRFMEPREAYAQLFEQFEKIYTGEEKRQAMLTADKEAKKAEVKSHQADMKTKSAAVSPPSTATPSTASSSIVSSAVTEAKEKHNYKNEITTFIMGMTEVYSGELKRLYGTDYNEPVDARQFYPAINAFIAAAENWTLSEMKAFMDTDPSSHDYDETISVLTGTPKSDLRNARQAFNAVFDAEKIRLDALKATSAGGPRMAAPPPPPPPRVNRGSSGGSGGMGGVLKPPPFARAPLRRASVPTKPMGRGVLAAARRAVLPPPPPRTPAPAMGASGPFIRIDAAENIIGNIAKMVAQFTGEFYTQGAILQHDNKFIALEGYKNELNTLLGLITAMPTFTAGSTEANRVNAIVDEVNILTNDIKKLQGLQKLKQAESRDNGKIKWEYTAGEYILPSFVADSKDVEIVEIPKDKTWRQQLEADGIERKVIKAPPVALGTTPGDLQFINQTWTEGIDLNHFRRSNLYLDDKLKPNSKFQFVETYERNPAIGTAQFSSQATKIPDDLTVEGIFGKGFESVPALQGYGTAFDQHKSGTVDTPSATTIIIQKVAEYLHNYHMEVTPENIKAALDRGAIADLKLPWSLTPAVLPAGLPGVAALGVGFPTKGQFADALYAHYHKTVISDDYRMKLHAMALSMVNSFITCVRDFREPLTISSAFSPELVRAIIAVCDLRNQGAPLAERITYEDNSGYNLKSTTELEKDKKANKTELSQREASVKTLEKDLQTIHGNPKHPLHHLYKAHLEMIPRLKKHVEKVEQAEKNGVPGAKEELERLRELRARPGKEYKALENIDEEIQAQMVIARRGKIR